MEYCELKITLFLKQDMRFDKLYFEQARYIFEAFNDKNALSKWHFENRYKLYTFDLLYNKNIKIEGGLYLRQNSYSFRIRSVDKKLIEVLQERLPKVQNQNFSYITMQTKTIKQFFITSLRSLTPTIISSEKNLFWTIQKDGDILKLQRLLHENLEKKYKSFYGDIKPQQNFIQLLEIQNQKPQTIEIEKNGKKVRFFGNKFKIVPNEDEASQKLAFLALGAGLGEKNSYGGGFCERRK